MKVTKRNGTQEEYNVDKIHKILGWAVEGIENVSISDIEINSKLSLYDGISTEEIHHVLIKSANDLISAANPNYQWVAARLLLYALRKKVWGCNVPPRLYDHIKNCVDLGIYTETLLQDYTEAEIHKIGQFIKHDRDYLFTYSGLQQLIDKYLLKNRHGKEIYETPQFVYIIIAMICFAKYDKRIRLEYIKKTYNYLSTFKISLPTPIITGIRTKIKQFASCVLIDVGDSLDSIFSSVSAVGYYSAKRAGIGLNVGRIRPINSSIRNGEVIHTGLLPYIRVFESIVKSTSQNGIRGASGTVNVPFFHPEIMDVIVLKNNGGTEENRIRKLDYCIQFSRIFYQRLINNEHVTLFSPHECPDLYESFGTDSFDEIYQKYENTDNLKYKNKIPARELIELFCRERIQTGRIYLMNVDHCNSHGSFLETIRMTNLCVEVTHPTKPLSSIDDKDALIGVCVLSAINLLETKKDEIPDVCDIIVRMLDEIIDYQEYPILAAENFCKKYRSLGIGVTNLASFLAKNKLSFDSKEALELVNEYAELTQYSLLSSSNALAIEKGKCEFFDKTKYSLGILPIDTYKKSVDSIVTPSLKLNWEELRQKIKEHGLRHSTVTCQMPVESSSVIQNSTNGIEPVRDLISYKKSKSGVLKQVVPYIQKYGKYYTKAFSVSDNSVYTNIAAVFQKYFDMSLSLNHYYNYDHYDDKNIPIGVIIKDILYAYKMGIKTLYYANTNDGDKENSSCDSGGCTL